MKLSYIVSVYNMEKYLIRCVESLVRQKMSDCEILLIDDGSTDLSSRYCDELQESRQCIRVIRQENQGLAAARNTGLRAAAGDYILFVDADDWLAADTAERMYQEAAALDLDIGVGDFTYVFEDGSIRANEKKPVHFELPVPGKTFFLQSMKTRTALKAVWKSIYRRSFLLENQLFFQPGYNHEDEEWTPRVYLKARRVKDIPVVFYRYFIRGDSISRDPAAFEKNALDIIHNCERLKVLSMTERGELRRLFQDRIVNLWLSAVFKGRLTDAGYKDRISCSFFKHMHLEWKTRAKVLLFCVSRRLYYRFNLLLKTKSIRTEPGRETL